MRTLTDLQKKIYPDLLDAMHQRYAVLKKINTLQPIGRRGLVEGTDLTERIIRSEVTVLQSQGLIEITAKGMYITNEGKLVMEQLNPFIQTITGLSELEQKVKAVLQIESIIIVPGNSDQSDWVKQEIGKACASYLKKNISTEATIAVTGGTTIAAVAKAMTPLNELGKYMFVPARGGIDELVEYQANTIVAEMAQKALGDYHLLYVPDPLSEESYHSMIKEPSISNILQLIREADIILHGIGDATKMAKRRKTTSAIMEKLQGNKAVSEAFGYYFDQQGHVVHQVRTIGIQIEDLNKAGSVIALAGGQSKAKSIISYFKQGKSDLLITDEAAANEILKINELIS